MHPISGRACSVCGGRLPGAKCHTELHRCAACQESRPSFAKARAYGAYQSELRDLIHLLKYGVVLPAARTLGRIKPTLVVPVPLHASKRRQRGLNRWKMIAHLPPKKSGSAKLQLAPTVLVRKQATVSQIGLTRFPWLEHLRGAFRVAHPSGTEGRAIQLVDDILTSGATSESARFLRKVRTKNVWLTAVARPLNESAILQVAPEFKAAAQAS